MKYGLALVAGIIMAGSYAEAQTPYNPEWRSRNWPDRNYAASVLGVKQRDIQYFPNGYVSDKEGTKCLNSTAGLRARTIKLRDGKYKPDYRDSFFLGMNEQIFLDACKEADIDKDRVVTKKEACKLFEREMEIQSKRQKPDKQ